MLSAWDRKLRILNPTSIEETTTSRRLTTKPNVSSNGQVTPSEKPIYIFSNMGVSENSVPLIPMVNDHYPY